MTSDILNFDGQYRYLSNFYMAPAAFEGVVYPSSEQAYQAAKFPAQSRDIFCRGTPGIAKKLGRMPGMRADWDTVKVNVMRAIVRDKFTRNADLGRLLVSTGDVHLIEGNWWNDTFWGVCKGRGQNWLGQILMEIRTELQLF